MGKKSVVEEWGYTGLLKAEGSGWDRQRRQGRVFQVVGHRINKGQMAGRRWCFGVLCLQGVENVDCEKFGIVD